MGRVGLTPRLAPGSWILQVTGSEGNRVVAEGVGQGSRTVVVLPGGGQERSRWAKVAVHLAHADMRCVVIDLRGHGDSERSPNRSYELADYARDVQSVLEALAVPVTLAGHSMGGRVALLMTPENPLVERLVLIDSCPDMPADEPANEFLLGTTEGFTSLDEAFERMEGHYQRAMNRESIAEELRRGEDDRFYWHWDPGVLDRLMGDLAVESATLCRAARDLRVPSLLVRTEFSQFVDDAAEARLRAWVPQLQVEVLADSHHHRPWARPRAMARYLEGFSRSNPTQLLTTLSSREDTRVNTNVDQSGS